MRGFILLIGLVLVGVAIFVVVAKDSGPPAVDEIDEQSRAKLEQVLDEAEREEAARR
jgi:hypothetical protein